MLKHLVSGFILIVFSNSTFANSIKLQSNSSDNSLPNKLMIEALNRLNLSAVYPYENVEHVSIARVMNDLSTGDTDVMWSMTSAELEKDYKALYYPIFRGLIGMRLPIVKQKNRDLFKNVTTLSQLKNFVAGQGKTWPDTQILESNGLTVAKTLKYPNLFYMLEGERFDYFPRAIYEPWDEVASRPELKLVVEPHLIINYVAPFYFFINKNNVELEKKLITAFESMLEDGTFERMFFADDQLQKALQLSNVSQRTVIALDNPSLTDKTPLSRKQLWFDPLTYKENQ